jgi:16S rRNA (guanine966-N2)-methyltransferase
MRIIAGRLRSRRLVAPPGTDVRPTSDRLRETLFNVLSPRIEGARFLDLYAGTGAVGIEAVSRGANESVLVESNKRAARTIRENVDSLELAQEITVMEADAVKALRSLKGEFDLVFLDPPYSMHGQYEACLNALATLPILAADAIVIAEHDKRFTPKDEYDNLHCYRRLVQGDATLSLYRAGRTSSLHSA